MSDREIDARDKEIVQGIDPFEASSHFLLIVAFAKSSSRNFPLALSVAKGAERFEVGEIGGKPVYFAHFGKSQAEAGRALALLDYVRSWKGVQVFSNGMLLKNTWEIEQVLGCYLKAMSCKDPTAHCHTIVDDPFSDIEEESGLSLSISLHNGPPLKEEIEVKRYLFPCKFLLHLVRFQKELQATIENQIQAAAVDAGCNWCPNFNPDNWKHVGVRKVVKEHYL